MNFGDLLLNAAAVWFLLKTIEGVPLAFYDFYVIIRKIVLFCRPNGRNGNEEQANDNNYDRRRGKFEYVLSGEGFFDFWYFQGRKSLSFFPTAVPMCIFVLEMASIYLGSEITKCDSSRDLDIVSGPCLELFGGGERATNMEQLVNQSFGGGSSMRRCVRWSASFSGVEYEASVCGTSPSTLEHLFASLILSPASNRIGHAISKNPGKLTTKLLFPYTVLSMPFEDSTNATYVYSGQFDAELKVNGKGTLLQDVIRIDEISEQTKQLIREDVKRFEDLREIPRSKYFEDDKYIGIQWKDRASFEKGLDALTLSVLSQTTRGFKSASMMSSANLERPSHEFDVSCRQDFLLPKKASIIIIGTAIALRIIIYFIPTSLSSVKFALNATEEG